MTTSASTALQGHPQELIEHYVFQCDAVDTFVRIRSLKGCRAKQAHALTIACRMVYENARQLFRNQYEGFPTVEDDALLMKALAADEALFPHQYTDVPELAPPVRRARPRQEDMLLEVDFVDPQIGFAKGNILLVGRRSLRFRDRATVEELDSISAYFIAQKKVDPTVKMEFVDQGRWPLVP